MHACCFASSAQRRNVWSVGLSLAVLVVVVAAPRSALGHGNPVLVQGGAEALGIGWGLTDVRGYARQVFADIDEDAGLSPAPGNRYATTLPGFDLQDLQAGDDLWIEAIARPFTAEGGVENRWLWHWQASIGAVTELPAVANLQLASARGFLPSVFLTQDVAPQHTSVQLADVLPTDVNQHRHLITYVVSNPALAAGDVYAFFGRLHAPGYAPSEPLLIAVQSGLGAAAFQAAALQINAAALLPGDFDHNDAVDGVDLLVWQRAFASVGEHPADMTGDGAVEGGDLALWSEFLGRRWPADVGAVTTIPEAGTGPLALLAALLGGRTRGAHHRRARTAPRALAPARSFWRRPDSSRATRPPAIGWPVTYRPASSEDPRGRGVCGRWYGCVGDPVGHRCGALSGHAVRNGCAYSRRGRSGERCRLGSISVAELRPSTTMKRTTPDAARRSAFRTASVDCPLCRPSAI